MIIHNNSSVGYSSPANARFYSHPTIVSNNQVLHSSNPTAIDRPNNRPRPRDGKWLDSICDWPSNIFPSCWCACCCCYGMWLVGQMSEKTGFASFNKVFGAYSVIFLISFILELAIGTTVIIWLPLLTALGISIALRLHIVRKYGITECDQNHSGLNQFGECCCGFWCWSCSVSQMARHLYGYSKVLDGDSDIYRPDNYDTPSLV